MLKSYMLRKQFIKEKYYEFKKTDLYEHFTKYVATGLMSVTIEYSLFRLMLDILEIHYLIANTIAYIIVFWFGFLMYKFWVFKSRGNTRRQLILYLVLFTINIGALNGLMYVLSGIVGIPPEFSKIMAMGSVVLWNFIIYRKVIYK